MKAKVNDFSALEEIYSQFTEKNKENILKTAKHLLKVQKEDAVLVSDAVPKKKKGNC